jgi:hypothetical protein
MQRGQFRVHGAGVFTGGGVRGFRTPSERLTSVIFSCRDSGQGRKYAPTVSSNSYHIPNASYKSYTHMHL